MLGPLLFGDSEIMRRAQVFGGQGCCGVVGQSEPALLAVPHKRGHLRPQSRVIGWRLCQKLHSHFDTCEVNTVEFETRDAHPVGRRRRDACAFRPASNARSNTRHVNAAYPLGPRLP